MLTTIGAADALALAAAPATEGDAALMLAEALAVATADEAEAIADLTEATADVGTTVTTALGLAVL